MVENTGTGPALQLKNRKVAPPLRVNSNKVVRRLNVWLLRGKAPAAFTPAGSSYTKAESDGKYPLTANVYTKAESDGKYPLATNVYTKAQADAAFEPKGGIQILALTRSLSAFNGVEVLDTTVTIPANGTLIVAVEAECFVDNDSKVYFSVKASSTTSSTSEYGPNEGTNEVRIGCVGSVSAAVTPGSEPLRATANIGSGASVQHMVTTVYFVPD